MNSDVIFGAIVGFMLAVGVAASVIMRPMRAFMRPRVDLVVKPVREKPKRHIRPKLLEW